MGCGLRALARLGRDGAGGNLGELLRRIRLALQLRVRSGGAYGGRAHHARLGNRQVRVLA
jgi:hypothetical protein